MERYTTYGGEIAILTGDWIYHDTVPVEYEDGVTSMGDIFWGKAVDRLAAYEETGFTPEQIKEMAEKSARLVAKKPEHYTSWQNKEVFLCPHCGITLKRDAFCHFCACCGQSIDWQI